MNKKFSTFLVGALLACGIFSANAQTATNLSTVADKGYYYVLKVHGSNDQVPYAESWSVAVKGGQLVTEQNTAAVAKENAWKATAVMVNGNAIGFKFVNANGVAMRFDENGDFTTKASAVKYDTFTHKSGKIFAVNQQGQAIDGKYLIQEGNVYKLGATGTDAKFYTLPTVELTKDQLDAPLETGFSITIGKTKYDKDTNDWLVWDGAYELEGNVFTGKLTPKQTVEGIMLQREDGKYIVLTSSTWGTLSNSLQADDAKAGYKFAAMSEAQINAAKAGTILAKTFTVTQPSALSNQPLEVVANGGYELMVATVNGVNYLTTGAADNQVNADEQLVGKASYTNNYDVNTKKTTENTYVIFGDGNDVDYAIFNDAVWNISWTNADGKTLVAGPSCGGTWVPAAQVATAYPEGQWLWNGEVFVNRESGVELPLSGLRKIEGKELTFSKDGNIYTFVKAGVPGHVTDAYLNGTNDEFLKEAFHIGTPLAYGDTVYLAKDEKGALYFVEDKAEAVEFRMTKEVIASAAVGDDKESDLIRHYTTYASSLAKDGFATDTLSLHRYFVTEAATGLMLAFDGENQRYALTSEEEAKDDAVIFKNKAADLYNLVQWLTINDETNNKGEFLNHKYDVVYYGSDKDYMSYAFCDASKLYGAHNTAELKYAVSAYRFTENDLFTLTKVDAGQHVSGIEGDTIKIFRNIDNNYVLYESGKLLADAKGDAVEGFLAIQNFLDPKYADKNAAMYVDGAAGLDTWRPEYMLVLDHNIVDAKNDLCEICGQPNCAHSHVSRGYVEGRYLVNLVDSAEVAKRKDCVFQNYNGDKYYRLGFVHAKHVGDSLVIASSNDTLNLTGNDFAKMNVCEFAFHYVDKAREAFTIETAYSAARASKEDVLLGKAEVEGELMSSVKGWVKFHNGIPVVTKEGAEAEVFNLELTDETPTANEEVAVSEVSVVAVDGAVVVKGAAGKAVAISNILGQTIANTVIASDNETIAVPAGIVVVAVEGEEAVKAIVK